MDVIFEGVSKYSLMGLLVLGIIYMGIYITKCRKRLSLWQKCQVGMSIAMGVIIELLLMNKAWISFIGFPMLLVSMMVIFFGRVVRIYGKES